MKFSFSCEDLSEIPMDLLVGSPASEACDPQCLFALQRNCGPGGGDFWPGSLPTVELKQ